MNLRNVNIEQQKKASTKECIVYDSMYIRNKQKKYALVDIKRKDTLDKV